MSDMRELVYGVFRLIDLFDLTSADIETMKHFVDGDLTYKQLGEKMKISYVAAQARAKSLLEKGVLVKKGVLKNESDKRNRKGQYLIGINWDIQI